MTWIEQIFGQSVSGGRVACALLGGYAAGCLATGYYLIRMRFGLDIRELGSGSVGARNAGRIMGAPGFIFTVAGDFSKGAVVVWAARHLWDDQRLTGLAMLAVVFGHIFPLQLGFKGGKGVVTSCGALAVYDFRLALAFGALAALFALFGRLTPAGLIAFAMLPVGAKMLERGPLEIIIISALSGMILFAHRKNLIEEFAHLGAAPEAHTKPDHPLD
jgi:acyl phosphate:glycerol-3-phosphate acyltransferase